MKLNYVCIYEREGVLIVTYVFLNKIKKQKHDYGCRLRLKGD